MRQNGPRRPSRWRELSKFQHIQLSKFSRFDDDARIHVSLLVNPNVLYNRGDEYHLDFRLSPSLWFFEKCSFLLSRRMIKLLLSK
jgi:hypothetical protein